MFGQRLRALRKQAGYTQAELAEKVGVSQYTISNYEQESRQPPLELLVQLADVLGTSTDYLLGRVDADESRAAGASSVTIPSERWQAFGPRLKTVREARFLSPEQCALLMGISGDQWRAWEAGDQYPTLAELLQAADTLHVSLDWLLNRQDPTLFAQSERTKEAESGYDRRVYGE
ncbi:MAG: hypothetical protein C7B44_06905 [Sulfobacillus thermosulfidooxidans]|nr:MAG: hypothetical protein C7B44_06905 [Sulfobacillus thermosulfidooxidans]